MTLGHPDDARRFINIDETHHVFSNDSDKGGPRARRWAASFIARSGDRVVRNGRHTTGCYATNAYGETLPPLYILDSKAKYPSNYKIDTRVGEGLPRVYGKYGCDAPRWYSSYLAVRRKGGMDTSLWEMVLEEIILPLHPNTSLKVVRCPVTKKILSGPLIIKTDAGPGRLSTEGTSWEFRKRMWDAGVIILLGLPNGTAVNQELDQGYQTYQPAVKASTQRVVSIKLADRVLARKKARLVKEGKRVEEDQMPLLADLDDLDDLLDEEEDKDEDVVSALDGEEGRPEDVEDEDVVSALDGEEGRPEDVELGDELAQLVAEQDAPVEYRGSLMNVGLGNLDLGHMVDGYPGDPIERRPFTYCFTPAKVLTWWRKVGFLPMNRNALNDPKVRYELGEGGAPEDEGRRLALLEEAYKEGAAGLQRLGFNGIDVFDIELPRADDVKFGEKDEKKIDEMMKDGRMTAGKFMGAGLTIVNTDMMMEARKRRLAQIETEKEEKTRTEKEDGLNMLDYAVYNYNKWKVDKPLDKHDKIKLSKMGAIAIVKALMPRVDPTKNVSEFKTMKLCVDWLMSLEDWEAEMDALGKDALKERRANHKRLF